MKQQSPFRSIALLFAAGLLLAAGGVFAEQAASSGADPKAAQDPRVGDWSIHCVEQQKKDRPGCFLYQNLFDKKQKKLVMRIAIGFLEKKNEPVAMLTLPLGVGLRAGVLIKIDDNKGGEAPYEYCDRVGCRVTMKLAEEVVKSMREGKTMNISFATIQRQKVTVPVSLKGFDKAYEQVLKKNGIKK